MTYDYFVFTNTPAAPYGKGEYIAVQRITGLSHEEAMDLLPATVGKLVTVKATSVKEAIKVSGLTVEKKKIKLAA